MLEKRQTVPSLQPAKTGNSGLGVAQENPALDCPGPHKGRDIPQGVKAFIT